MKQMEQRISSISMVGTCKTAARLRGWHTVPGIEKQSVRRHRDGSEAHVNRSIGTEGARLVGLVLGLVAPALLACGCGKKVDCEAFCNREATCVADIAIQVGSATREQTVRLTDADRKALGERQRVKCRDNCMSPTKPSAVHTKWRKCMEEKGCEAFARCVYR